jgi:hypothetical protein
MVACKRGLGSRPLSFIPKPPDGGLWVAYIRMPLTYRNASDF